MQSCEKDLLNFTGNLKSNETCMVRNKIIYKFVLYICFSSLTALTQNGRQHESHVRQHKVPLLISRLSRYSGYNNLLIRHQTKYSGIEYLNVVLFKHFLLLITFSNKTAANLRLRFVNCVFSRMCEVNINLRPNMVGLRFE